MKTYEDGLRDAAAMLRTEAHSVEPGRRFRGWEVYSYLQKIARALDEATEKPPLPPLPG